MGRAGGKEHEVPRHLIVNSKLSHAAHITKNKRSWSITTQCYMCVSIHTKIHKKTWQACWLCIPPAGTASESLNNASRQMSAITISACEEISHIRTCHHRYTHQRNGYTRSVHNDTTVFVVI